ncbi:MAG TPA: hypothetical protein VF698_13820, partial [Thermoanaerobaculia bacterium]
PAAAVASPFEFAPVEAHAETAVELEDDPFAHVAVADEPAVHIEPIDDPFAQPTAVVHDGAAERERLEALLANARAVVASLEDALEKAREQERAIESLLS